MSRRGEFNSSLRLCHVTTIILRPQYTLALETTSSPGADSRADVDEISMAFLIPGISH